MVAVPGYAVGTVIGRSGAQMKRLRLEHPGVFISVKHMDREETFIGPRSHQMDVYISGPHSLAMRRTRSSI